jgi:predicted dehydrogenase
MTRIAIIGCGNIANNYAKQIPFYSNFSIAGFFDVVPERVNEFVAAYGGKAYTSLDEVFSDKDVDLVINLTIHHSHFEVIRQSLNAGKDIYTEKPLALSYSDARTLVDLARKKDVRLGSAPINYMGEAQQTVWKMIEDGEIGKVRSVYAEVNHKRIESWHPRPQPFYDIGVLWDVGVYPLTLLTCIFGAARKVQGMGKVLLKERKTKEGIPFTVSTPDYYQANIEFENGTIARLTANFYALNSKQGGSLEFHGDTGSIHLEQFQKFNSQIELSRSPKDVRQIPCLRETPKGIDYSRGIEDMALAIQEGRPHRASGEHAAHVIEIMDGISKSIAENKMIEIQSNFPKPSLLDWTRPLATAS